MSRGKDMPENSDCAMTGFRFFNDMDFMKHYIFNEHWKDANERMVKFTERAKELKGCGVAMDRITEDIVFMGKMVKEQNKEEALDAYDTLFDRVIHEFLS